MTRWIFLAILSAFFAACVPILAKRGLAGVDTMTATALRALVMAGFLSLLVFVRSGTRWAVGDVRGLTWIAASGLAGALSWLCYFAALEKGPASSVAALDRTSVIFAVVMAGVFLAEEVTMRVMVGALLVAAGATLVAWR
jgi:transporter family protein